MPTIKIGESQIRLSLKQAQELRYVLNDMLEDEGGTLLPSPAQTVWHCKTPDSTESVTVTLDDRGPWTEITRTTKWDTP